MSETTDYTEGAAVAAITTFTVGLAASLVGVNVFYPMGGCVAVIVLNDFVNTSRQKS